MAVRLPTNSHPTAETIVAETRTKIPMEIHNLKDMS